MRSFNFYLHFVTFDIKCRIANYYNSMRENKFSRLFLFRRVSRHWTLDTHSEGATCNAQNEENRESSV